MKSLRSRRRPEAVEVMEKPKRRQTDNVIVLPDALAAAMTDRDVARRAYDERAAQQRLQPTAARRQSSRRG